MFPGGFRYKYFPPSSSGMTRTGPVKLGQSALATPARVID